MSEQKSIDNPAGEAQLPYIDLKVSQLEDLPSEVRLIDVREKNEFFGELGHLEGAELVPLDSLSTKAADWDPAGPLLLICRSGNRSSKAAMQLAHLGFTRVANLAGGMTAVRAENGGE